MKGSGAEVTGVRLSPLSTSRHSSVVTLLREALRNEDGSEKDLLAPLPSLSAFRRKGLDLSIEFRCGKQLSKPEASACFALAKEHMQKEYDASGYGWDDDDKWGEICSREARLLLLFDAASPARPLVGFVSFRLTLQGECWNAMEGAPCLFVYDLHVASEYRRKGVGKQLLLTLEIMAKRANLGYVCALLTSASEQAATFFSSVKGWRDDTASIKHMEAADPDDDTFRVYAKCLDGAVLKEKEETVQVGNAQRVVIDRTPSSHAFYSDLNTIVRSTPCLIRSPHKNHNSTLRRWRFLIHRAVPPSGARASHAAGFNGQIGD